MRVKTVGRVNGDLGDGNHNVSERSIFRQKSLDKLSSPDELDRLLNVVSLRGWIPLAISSALCCAALVWSIFGRIPVTVIGRGVLISPGNVRGLQSQATGQLIDMPLRVGQQIMKGDVIGVLNQSQLRKQLEQADTKLTDLIVYDTETRRLEQSRRELERTSAASQTQFLTEEIRKLEELTKNLAARNKSFNDTQRDNLARAKTLTESLHQSFKKVYSELTTLKSEGLASGQTLLQSEREFNESLLRLANLDVQLRELDLREIQGSENLIQQENRISDQKLQIEKLGIQEQKADQEIRELQATRENEISEQRRLLERLKLELASQTEIKCQYSGRVLEISVAPGQLVQAGERLGTMEVDDPSFELKCLAYFAVKDGKRVAEGMTVHVTPSTVQREREGSIIGKVWKCSKFPITHQGAVNMVGNQEIAASLTDGGGMIEVEANLERDPNSVSGYQWTSKGPDLKFSAGTTTSIRVTVEHRAPITYVLPVLRSWLFGAKDDEHSRS